MTLPELDGQQIFGLVSLLAVLALWIGVFRSQRRWARWMKQKEQPPADRPEPPRKDHGGPWG